MPTFRLANGKPIDEMMIETAMDDFDTTHSYFLNTETGEVRALSDYDMTGDEWEEEIDEIDGSDNYVAIERIESYEAYRWMENFVEQVIAPRNPQAAEKLSIALMGKGAFGRFKHVLHMVGDKWVEAWYRYHDERVKEAMYEWFESLDGVVIKVEQ